MSYFGPDGTPLDAYDSEQELLDLREAHKPILEEVEKEIWHSIVKFGVQSHSAFVWNSILGEEFGEACQAAVQAEYEPGKHTWADYRKELVQTACVAIKAIEAFDRNKTEQGK